MTEEDIRKEDAAENLKEPAEGNTVFEESEGGCAKGEEVKAGESEGTAGTGAEETGTAEAAAEKTGAEDAAAAKAGAATGAEEPGTEDVEAETAGAEEFADESADESDDGSEDGEGSGQEASGEAAQESGAKGPKKKGFFGRGKKEDKEKAALQEKVADLEDRVKRQMAEFDNFRKRTDKEKEQMFSMGEKNVLEKMLPVIDNFERGFGMVAPEDQDDAFVDGMRKIYAQLMKQMEDLGVKPIDAAGKEFDPNLHNAVMQVESDELASGTVAQELQKGYMYRDSVLRHSMVSVVS